MAITEVGNASAGASSGSAYDCTHGLTIQADDVVLAFVAQNDQTTTITDNNGANSFTDEYQQGGQSGETHRHAVFARVAGASEPATYKFSGASARWSVIIRVFRGVNTSNIWDIAPLLANRNNGSGTSASINSITTNNNGSMALGWVATDDYRAVYSSPSNGFGSLVSQASGTTQNQATATKLITTAGAVGATTINIDATYDWLTVMMALNEASSGITGTLSETEANDTLSASGALEFTGTLSQTEADDTLSATGTAGDTVTGTLSETEANDTLSASGALEFAGGLAETEESDTLSADGLIAFSGGLSETEENDTLSASGVLTFTGALSETEENDTLSASGVVSQPVTGSLAKTEENDTLSATNLEWLDITGRYRLNGREYLITNQSELVDLLEVTTTRNEARAVVAAYLAANGLDAGQYVFSSEEKKILASFAA